jgi:hypothetical protein
MKPLIIWKDSFPVLQSKYACLGAYNVCAVFQEIGIKGEPRKWIARILLPGIKIKDGIKFNTVEEAMEKCEKFIARWLDRAELIQNYNVVLTEEKPPEYNEREGF